MGHTALNSKGEFDNAINGTPDKFVLIYCYENEVSAKAEEFSNKFASTCAAYKVDVATHAAAKQYFSITTTPTVVLFKGGKEIKRVEGGNEEQMAQVVEVLGG